MRIKKEHYDQIRSNIMSLDKDAVLRHKGLLLGKDRNRRFYWDLLYASTKSAWVCDNVYPYADDNHLETALRKIVSELGL